MKALYKRGVYEVDKVGENSNLVQLNKDGVPLVVSDDQIDYLDISLEGKKFIFNPDGVSNDKVFAFNGRVPYEHFKRMKKKECEVIGLRDEFASVILLDATYCVNVRCLERIEPILKVNADGICIGKLNLTTQSLCASTGYDGFYERRNEMELLELWKSRSLKKLDKEFEEEKASIIEKDPVTEVRNQFEVMKNNFIEEYKEKGMDVGIDISMKGFNYSRETVEKLGELRESYMDNQKEIADTYEEAKARLEICENEESKIKVLKDFEILDKNGRLDV